MNKIQNGLSKESKSVFWRWYFLGGAGWNYEKMQGLGYFYSMLPMIKKQKDEEDRKNLAKTELQFLTPTTQWHPLSWVWTVPFRTRQGRMPLIPLPRLRRV